MSVPVPSTPTNPADLREQIAQALALARDYREGTSDAVDCGPSVADYADARAALSAVAPALEGLRRERDAARLWNKAHETNNAALGQTNRELAAERDALSSLLRGMTRRVGDFRRELTELAAELPCGWCKGTGIAPEETFGRDGDGAPMVDGDQPCPEGCRPSVSDQTPDDGDPFEIRSHAYRRANVCYECGQPPSAHASDQTPATPDEPRRNALVSVDMGALIRAERAHASVQGDTTPISTLTGLPCTGHAPDHRCIECASDTELRAATSAPSEGDHHA